MTDDVDQLAPWAPLSRRDAGLGPDETLHDGVPAHLRRALEEWIGALYRAIAQPSGGELLPRVLEMIQLSLRWAQPPTDPRRPSEQDLLDLLDALLDRIPRSTYRFMTGYGGDPVSHLDFMLTSAGSAWRVNSRQDGLERRVDGTVNAAAQATITSSQAASQHLAAAWTAAYGRRPDPDKSYAEAVKAVEALACPLVLKKKTEQGNAILSDVIGHLRSPDGGAKWELLLTDAADNPAPVAPLVEMMGLLMRGHRSRHAGGPNTRAQTQAEAEAAVHLAATLVQWFSTGVLRKKP